MSFICYTIERYRTPKDRGCHIHSKESTSNTNTPSIFNYVGIVKKKKKKVLKIVVRNCENGGRKTHRQ